MALVNMLMLGRMHRVVQSNQRLFLSNFKILNCLTLSKTPEASTTQRRTSFYLKNAKFHSTCDSNITRGSLGDILAGNDLHGKPSYISTRGSGSNEEKDFLSTVLTATPTDGGLFVPNQSLPKLTNHELYNISVQDSFKQRAVNVMMKLLQKDEISSLEDLVSSVVCDEEDWSGGLHELGAGSNRYVYDMGGSVTGSGEDYIQTMTLKLLQEALKGKPDNSCLLVLPTTGDAGAAAVVGLKNWPAKENLRLAVIYPQGRISDLDRAMMETHADPSMLLIEVAGDYDFCQQTARQVLSNSELRQEFIQKYNHHISTTCSWNWGSMLAHVSAQVHAYLSLVRARRVRCGGEVDYCVPAGDMTAAMSSLYAKQMGIPFRRILLACGSCNTMTELVSTGRLYHRPDNSGCTRPAPLSPALDVSVPGNLERYIHQFVSGHVVEALYEGLEEEGCLSLPGLARSQLQRDLKADWVTDESIQARIGSTFTQSGYLLDAQGAAAYQVALKSHLDTDTPMIFAAPSHFIKSAPLVLRATGRTGDSLRELCDEVESTGKPCNHLYRHWDDSKPTTLNDTSRKVTCSSVKEITDQLRKFVVR